MIASTADYRQGRRFILCDLICGNDLVAAPLAIVDAGALDAFVGSRWIKLPADKVRVHGFEPDAAECQRLNAAAATAGVNFQFHPIALARKTGPADFYRFAEPAANSFYAANDRLIRRWCYTRSLTLSSQFKVLERATLQAVSLADWARVNSVVDVDFIKLNVQGSELDILSGAGHVLESSLGLLVEQTFNGTYKGAPLFGEVYDFLNNAGFCMFDVAGINRVARTRSPIHLTEDKIFVVDGLWPHHQFLEGHFLYLRDPIGESDYWDEQSSWSLEKCVKLACLAETFGQVEYAFEILDWIASSPRAGGVAARCRELIEQAAEIYRQVSHEDKSAVGSSVGAHSGPLPPMISLPRTAEQHLSSATLARLVEIGQLQGRYDAVLAENVYLRGVLEQMRSSRSWKLTRPLRDFVDWARSRRLIGGKRSRAGGS
jgi:FkbM family methyltransferase